MSSSGSYLFFKFSPYIAICSLLVFIFSYYIGPFYFLGDQLHYNAVYSAISGLPISEAFDEYQRHIDSAEFVHFFVIWVGSNFEVNKNLLMSASNALLACSILNLFRKWNVSKSVAILFVFSNFYLLVLYFTTERLKFSFILFVFSLICSDSIWRFSVFSMFSILAHVQNLILYFVIIFSGLHSSIKKMHKLFSSLFFKLLFFILLFFFLYLFLYPHIQSKIEVYRLFNEKNFFDDSIIMLLFFAASIYYFPHKMVVFFSFIPIFFALYILGSDRINMVGYLCFFYFSCRKNRGLNFGIIVTSGYLLWKSVFYLYYIFDTGNGFGY